MTKRSIEGSAPVVQANGNRITTASPQTMVRAVGLSRVRAVVRSAWWRRTLAIGFAWLVAGSTADAREECLADFGRDGETTVEEIVVMLNESFRGCGLACHGDFNRDGAVTADEIVTAVNEALDGCASVPPTPTPTPTLTLTPTPLCTTFELADTSRDGRIAAIDSIWPPLACDSSMAFHGTHSDEFNFGLFAKFTGPFVVVPEGYFIADQHFWSWDTSSIGAGQTVVSATLLAAVVNPNNPEREGLVGSEDGLALQGEAYRWSPGLDCSDYDPEPGDSAFRIAISELHQGTNRIPLTPEVVDVTGATELRASVSGGAPHGVSFVEFLDVDHAGAGAPVALEVCYR